MSKETLKNLKETKEGEEIRMNKILRNKKLNNTNSSGCNNSSTFDTSRSKHKRNTRQ